LLNLISGETKEVQQVQNALAVQPRVGLHLHHRLRVPGNTQPRRSHHQEVVRAIAYGNDLGQVNALLAGNLDQEVALPLLADDKSLDLTRELAGIINDHLVGMRVIDAQLPGQPARKRKESTRKHCGLHTEALQGLDQAGHTLGHVQNWSQLLEEGRRKALQKLYTLAERGVELKFAEHGTMGDICDARGQVGRVLDGCGEQVNHLLRDEGAVHVEDDQPRVAAPQRVGLQRDVDTPFSFKTVDKLVSP
ncbi:hypothetical protein CT0861_00981, partial [Colletotrichum tofieldiae]